MTQPDLAESPLERARDAFRRHAWQQAYELFTAADAARGLSPDDLADLGEAAFASGQYTEAIQALERAYTAFTERNDAPHAAQVALALVIPHGARGAMAVAGGWLSTASRLLADQPDCTAHGQMAALEADLETLLRGTFDRAAELAQRASEIGVRFGDRDLQMRALMIRGRECVNRGAVEEAIPLLDEAMAAAVSGELRPGTSCEIYCRTVGTCHRLGDYRRAGEWTDAAERGNARENIAHLTGECRTHRAAVLRVRGSWDEAEAEAKFVCDYDLLLDAGGHKGQALQEIGEIRLRRGDFAATEDVFQQAANTGRTPQPGLALLRLAQGRPEDALSSIRNALASEIIDRLDRAGMLPAQAEIAIVIGDLDTARASAEEMDEIASAYGTAGLQASAATVRGAVHLAEGDAAEAVSSLRRGWRLWQQVEVPYEAARARMLLAAAYHLQDDNESARSELQAAKAALERLGAAPDARRAAELLDEYAPVSAAGAAAAGRATRTFMFTDIVKSTNLVEAIGDDAWEALLRWHDQTMRSLLAAHQGEEVKHAGDGFFFAFADSVSALECAVNIQRTLADHRAAHGFAPQVRIGLHVAEATRRGRDYSGMGIHEAARIAALGNGGEILASQLTLDGVSGGFATSQPRTVSLKGISEPVQIVAVDWR
jgi:class 3 adenylate cyclase